ncbi:MAG: hypothetical protein ACRCVU_20290 [Flavobacterium sp.]
MTCDGEQVTLHAYGDRDSGYEVFYEDEWNSSIDYKFWTGEMKAFVVETIGQYTQLDGISVEVNTPVDGFENI